MKSLLNRNHLSRVLLTLRAPLVTCGILLGSWATSAQGATIELNELLAPVTPGTEALDAWYLSTQAAGGGGLADFIGLGGDLENNQPLGIGAAVVTTQIGDNNDRARVYTAADYGDASTLLQGIDLAYSYYKQPVAGGNAFAAPALRMAIFSPDSTGPDTDSYGELVYEPTWNQPGGGSGAPPPAAWQNVVIDENTGIAGTPGGGDDTNTAGWWWTGGFGQANGAGGPPIRSLAEWEALLNLDTDFATARVVGFSLGVGTYNQGQVGYFDEVSITIPGGIDTTYDFEPIVEAPVPEPSTLTLALLGLVGVAVRRRRRRS